MSVQMAIARSVVASTVGFCGQFGLCAAACCGNHIIISSSSSSNNSRVAAVVATGALAGSILYWMEPAQTVVTREVVTSETTSPCTARHAATPALTSSLQPLLMTREAAIAMENSAVMANGRAAPAWPLFGGL